MKVHLGISDIRLEGKPTDSKTYEVLKRVDNYKFKDVTAIEILEYVKHGHTISPNIHKEGYYISSNTYDGQEVLFLDIDEGNLEPSEIREILIKQHLKPTIIYETFSSTDNNKRYRVVFLLNSRIKKENELTYIKNYFKQFGIFDTNAMDKARIFLGAKFNGYTYLDEKSILDKQQFLKNVFEYNIMLIRDKKLKEIKKEIEVVEPKEKEVLKIEKRTQQETGEILTQEYEYIDFETQPNNVTTLIDILENKDMVALKEFVNYNADYLGIDIEYLFDRDVIKTTKDLITLPLSVFLGVEEGEMIHCILPGHEDNHPSAVIFKHDNGSYVYQCKACLEGKVKNIINLFSDYLGEDNFKLLRDYFNINIGKYKNSVDIYELYVYITSEEFANNFPFLAKGLGYIKDNLEPIFAIAQEHATTTLSKDNDRLMFYYSERFLADILNIERSLVRRRRNYLALLGIISKVRKYEISEKTLAEIKDMSYNKDIKGVSTYFKIKRKDEYDFNELEKRAESIIKNKITAYNISFNKIKDNLSEELAYEVFPNNINNYNKLHISEVLEEIVYGNDYISLKDMRNNLQKYDIKIGRIKFNTSVIEFSKNKTDYYYDSKSNLKNIEGVDEEKVDTIKAHHLEKVFVKKTYVLK